MEERGCLSGMASSHPCVNFSIVQTRKILLGTIPPTFDWVFISRGSNTFIRASEPQTQLQGPHPHHSHPVVSFPTTDPLGTTHQVPLGRHGHTFTCWGNAQGGVIGSCPLHCFSHYAVGKKGQIISFSGFLSHLAIFVAINN